MVPVVKNTPANTEDIKRHGFNPWVGKIPWQRKWQPTLVFLPGKSVGQRSLEGYNPRVAKSWTPLKQHSTHTETFWRASLILQEPGKGQKMISPGAGYGRVNILGEWKCWIFPLYMLRMIKPRTMNGARGGVRRETTRGLNQRKRPLGPSNELSFVGVAHCQAPRAHSTE